MVIKFEKENRMWYPGSISDFLARKIVIVVWWGANLAQRVILTVGDGA
jgi:hypothetical protein